MNGQVLAQSNGTVAMRIPPNASVEAYDRVPSAEALYSVTVDQTPPTPTIRVLVQSAVFWIVQIDFGEVLLPGSGLGAGGVECTGCRVTHLECDSLFVCRRTYQATVIHLKRLNRQSPR